MHNPFGLFLALFAAFWLFLAARGMAKELKAPERTKWIKGTMYLLILIGAGGFFAAALSATGVIKPPTSFEWPAGYVRGVVTAVDGKHIVPLILSGRLQIYDSQWHFIRGWNVDASGGDFKVRCSSDGLIEISRREASVTILSLKMGI
jgi:GntP family permease